MRCWQLISAKSFVSLTAILFALAWVEVAFAQEEAAESGDKSGWVLGYALVILAIVLGLTAVCRPGNRSADVKLDPE